MVSISQQLSLGDFPTSVYVLSLYTPGGMLMKLELNMEAYNVQPNTLLRSAAPNPGKLIGGMEEEDSVNLLSCPRCIIIQLNFPSLSLYILFSF